MDFDLSDFQTDIPNTERATDETLKFLVEDLGNEYGPDYKKHQCIFVGAACQNLHIVPVAVLPGINVAKEPHDLDLYRWVPFYSDIITIDPDENVYTARPIPGNITYSYYHAPQRLAREYGPINTCVASLIGGHCDPWYGNMIVIKSNNVHFSEGSVVDMEDGDINMVKNLLFSALWDGIGFNID